MRRIAAYGLAAILGAGLGFGSALALAGLLPGSNTLAVGKLAIDGWHTDLAIGSKAADAYTRARVARHGLLALAKQEAVYFTRARDDAGQPLREACRYRLSGGPMPAAWWSVTLYDAASMLPENTDAALSIDASRAGQGSWEAVIASERPTGASQWISSRNAGTFDLTLRLYVPDPMLLANPAQSLEPPEIALLGCDDEGAR